MTPETTIYLCVLAIWLLTTIQGIWALLDGFHFYGYVRRKLRRAAEAGATNAGRRYEPKVALILPCCGVDERLEKTVAAVRRQNYARYEVTFAFESTEDPAYAAVGRWTADWRDLATRCVVAGPTEHRSQKIHNLLAAVGDLADDCEVIVFLDSDAVPHESWLNDLVAPLHDPGVGAATGFRWYTAAGGFAEGVRSAWNAASLSLLHNDKTNFCWGGSTAIRRKAFARLDIARRWDRALSDDYQVTRAVREAGLRIVFVPQALLPTRERTSFRRFWTFARRQYVITHVCAPRIWLAGLILSANFTTGASCLFALMIASAVGLIGDRTTTLVALAGWAFILSLAGAKALVRQLAVHRILRPPDVSWRDFVWDVVGVGPVGVVHLALFFASSRSRRFIWRNKVYEMISADETRVLPRHPAGSPATATPKPVVPPR